MEHVSTFFKEENDIFYKVGEKRGIEKGRVEADEEAKTLFVKSLLSKTDFDIDRIADIVGVTKAFVKTIKDGIQ